MKKILIANRGEIAVRIIRACREMGLSTVAVFSECDRAALHVRYADEAYAIGPSAPRDSYLRIDRILDAARQSGADAVHPGYGFLAENEDFAAAVRDAGLTFIGPTPEAVALMGSKTAARAAAVRAGVPVVPGTRRAARRPTSPTQEIARVAARDRLSAARQGGGRRRRQGHADGRPIRRTSSDAVRAARSEAGAAFGDAAVYLERRLVAAAPRRGAAARRPSRHGPAVRRARVLDSAPPPESRRRNAVARRHARRCARAMTSAAAAVARAVGYTNAGTIEFLLDDDGRFYFLEMNTRLQVEHPITEMVTGIDLVRWQIRIARGERLDLDPERMLRAERPRDRVPDLRRGSRQQLPAVAGPHPPAASAVGPGDSRRQRRDRRARRADLLRPDDLEAGRVGRGSARARSRACGARLPSMSWPASGRPCRSSPGCSRSPTFSPAGSTRPTSTRCLKARQGRPFVEPSPDAEEVAAIAAALQAVHVAGRGWPRCRARRTVSDDRPDAGSPQARVEGLR